MDLDKNLVDLGLGDFEFAYGQVMYAIELERRLLKLESLVKSWSENLLPWEECTAELFQERT